MTELNEDQLFEGVSTEIRFSEPGPTFGDLFRITGLTNPNFPPSERYDFGKHAGLGFDQIDDYFGVPSESDEGDDVIVWLYPVVDGEPVHHHPGPFDAVRLAYNVVRNPAETADQFLRCVEALAADGAGTAAGLGELKAEIMAITDYWLSQRVAPGSDEALELDY